MMNRVTWLDEAFHTVRLEVALIEEGRMKGNIDRPTVEMIPTTARAEPAKAGSSLRVQSPSRAKAVPRKPSTGAAIIQG